MNSTPYSTSYSPPSPGAFPMPQPGAPQPGMSHPGMPHPGMLQPEMSPAGVPSYGISVPQSAPQGKVCLEFVLSLIYLFFYIFNCISICVCY